MTIISDQVFLSPIQEPVSLSPLRPLGMKFGGSLSASTSASDRPASEDYEESVATLDPKDVTQIWS